MRGHAHARTRRLVIITAGALLLGSLPASVSAGGERTASLPPCGEPETVDKEHGTLVTPWQTVLDADGAVTGHRLVLRHDGRERVLRTGRRGFAMRVSARHLLVGERHTEGTRLDLIDLRHGCRRWTRVLDAHAYPGRDGGPGRIRLALHDRATRAYLEDRVRHPVGIAPDVLSRLQVAVVGVPVPERLDAHLPTRFPLPARGFRVL